MMKCACVHVCVWACVRACWCTSGERLLEEYESHVEAEENRKEESQSQLEKTSKTLLDVKSGIEHLTEKLKVLKTVNVTVTVLTLTLIHPASPMHRATCGFCRNNRFLLD